MFSNHAIAQMFNRGISVDAVEDSIINGEKIKSYPDDIPYPSYLIYILLVTNQFMSLSVRIFVQDFVLSSLRIILTLLYGTQILKIKTNSVCSIVLSAKLAI